MKTEAKESAPRRPRRFRRPPAWTIRSGCEARSTPKAPRRVPPVCHVTARQLASQEEAAFFASRQAKRRGATVMLFFRYVAIPVTPLCHPASISARLRAICPDPALEP